MTDPGKAEIRSTIRARLAALDPKLRSAASARIRERVLELPAWRQARSVLLFAALPDEPDLGSLVDVALVEGKRVALPVFVVTTGVYGARQIQDSSRDLVIGRYGVREPGLNCAEVPLAALDLVVLPGLAFTPDGWRLGRGGGFYDRLLKSTSAARCGVGRDEQLLIRLPAESHDVQLDYVLIPSATYRCRRGLD